MKKITLMLCACAMAFAGLLVSCNNGSEKIVLTDNKTYDYVYVVSGTKVVTFEDAATDPRDLLETRTTTETFSGANGEIWWSESDDSTADYKNYIFWVDSTKGNKEVKYEQTGTNKNTDLNTDEFTDYVDISDENESFYSLGEAYYLGNINLNNNPSWDDVAAYSEDAAKALTRTIKVTGSIEENDSITIVVTDVDDSTEDEYPSEEKAVYKTTTVWTYNFVKAGSAE